MLLNDVERIPNCLGLPFHSLELAVQRTSILGFHLGLGINFYA